MILTGNKIYTEIERNNIMISPFDKRNVNPNSYNYHLGKIIKESYENNNNVHFKTINLEEMKDGYVLQPGKMYLGTTYEKIGSKKYAMSLIGRSSIGRLGMFLQISANLGHTSSYHCWTLEIIPCLPIKVYYKMTVGQVSFWKNYGKLQFFENLYNKYNFPAESNINRL